MLGFFLWQSSAFVNVIALWSVVAVSIKRIYLVMASLAVLFLSFLCLTLWLLESPSWENPAELRLTCKQKMSVPGGSVLNPAASSWKMRSAEMLAFSQSQQGQTKTFLTSLPMAKDSAHTCL